MEQFELLLRLGLALAIGFLIGLERGWQEREGEEGSRAAGLRTFSLIGLLGGVFGALSAGGERLLLAAGLITLTAAVGAFMWRQGEHEKDVSATSLVAAMLTFMLGALAVLGDMAVASGAGVAAAILLAAKAQLHGWLERLTWPELRSGLLLAAMTFILLPILPDRAIDPWNAVNPYALWLMTILIAAVSFVGYAAVKVTGPERGLMLAASFGGLVASTAVTLTLARMARGNDKHVRLLAGGVLAAGAVMFLRMIAIAAFINLSLAKAILLPFAGAALAMAAVAALHVRSERGTPKHQARFTIKNPFELSVVLRFGLLLTVVTVAVAAVRAQWGDPGVIGLAAISGLADVDAITLSLARLGGAGPASVMALMVVALVNTVAKNAYAAIAGGPKLGLLTALGTVAAAVGGLGGWAVA